MRLGGIFYTLGYGGFMIALLMLFPLLLSIIHGYSGHIENFFIGFILTGFVSGAMFLTGTSVRRKRASERELLFIMILFYVILPILASVPFIGADQIQGMSAAYFESVSALTTTGGTVLLYPELEASPILLWRALLGWLGGLWILVFSVAVLAPLAVGGITLVGNPLLQHDADASLSARLGRPLRLLSPVYTGLTGLGVLAIMSGGVGFSEALYLGLSAISTTGFVPHSAGLAQYSVIAQTAISLLCLIGASSAPLLLIFGLEHKSFKLTKDSELKIFFILISGFAAMSYFLLPDTPVLQALMQSISLSTTAGFSFVPHGGLADWPIVWVMMPVLIGGMALSTAGGLKVMRAIILTKDVASEVARLAYPSSVQSVTFVDRRLKDRDFSAVWAFTSVFLLFATFGVLLGGLLGLPLDQAWPVVLGALTNSLSIANSLDLPIAFAAMGSDLQVFLVLLMIAGRVELLILLVLFTSSFWRYVR